MNENSFPKTRTAIILAMVYLACQMIADVAASKIFMLFGLALPGGTFIYALTFTIRDLVHKRLGKDAARLMIVLAGVINVGMAGYFMLVGAMPAAAFWPNQAAYDMILGIVPRIVIASIVAEVVSELLDTEIYHLWVTKVTTKYQWLRVLVSNGISAPVDSLVFGFAAFGGVLPVAAVLAMVKGQSIFKWALTLVSLPSIYMTKEG